MTDFTNLPADITPTAFFSLVEDALKHEPAPSNAAPDKLLIHVVGDGGGTWAMGFEGGRLAIAPGTASTPPVQVSVSTDDLRAFVAGSIRDAIKAKAGGRTIDAREISKVYAITGKTEQIKSFSGDVQLVVENAGAAHRLTLTFGGGAPKASAPNTTISVGLSDFLGMLGGEVNPQMAFMMGQIRLDGDMNLAMGLASLMMG